MQMAMKRINVYTLCTHFIVNQCTINFNLFVFL